jgi:hypothetical protein
MKTKITFLAILMFAGILTSQAQQGLGKRRTAEERTKMIGDKLSDSLKFNAAQRTDIDAVYMEFYKNQDKLREGLAAGARPERSDLDKLNESRDARLKVILNEEQYNKLKQMEAAMRNRGVQAQKSPGQ